MNNQYRQNVGLVIINNNLIFAGFRIDVPENSKDGWQMPQGGIDENENILTAGYRELLEETGIKKENVKLIAQMPESIKYNFTEEIIKKNKSTKWKNYIGQEQHWLVFNFIGNDTDINLKSTEEPQEFRKYEWKTSEFLEKNVFKMKQETYKKVFNWLKKENILL